MSQTVAIQDLRVGMYVHLDLGWLAHPFPLSSFRIASVDQIATIRGLGVQTLRWVPEKSVPEPSPAPGAGPVGGAQPAAPGVAAQAGRDGLDQLAAQRAASQLCERQYGEADRAWCEAAAAVVSRPLDAGAGAQALTGALLDKLMVDGEMCIRLLSGGAGERATAHTLNVAVISLLMGRSFGMSRADMQDLGTGALMHDVGKLDLGERLRYSDGTLNAADVSSYRSHVAHGAAHGRHMGLSPGALLVLEQHHEHADGSGFPTGLVADRMSPAARIVAMVNRYDNLCNPVQLSRALTPHEALSTLFAQSRSKYDATILNAFIRMMGVYPAGSVVQLTDDRYAMVISVNASRPLKPRVLVHAAGTARDAALFIDLESMPDLGIRRSLNPSKLPPAAREFLSPLPQVSYFFEPPATNERLPSAHEAAA